MNIKNINIEKKVLIVAEIGNNHEGSFELATELIKLAYKSGADAVKFQTIEPNLLVSNANKERLEKLKSFYFTKSQYIHLRNLCDQIGILFLSTPFSIDCIDWLKDLVPAFKISSGDLTYISLIKEIAKTGKPIILSTGMSNLKEIENAISIISENSPLSKPKEHICLMHCVSAYPTKDSDANLRCIETLKDFGCEVGYSDHTQGIDASVCAVGLGARIIEKHFTISKNYSSFRDHQLSSDPKELKSLIEKIRHIEKLLGSKKKELLECEKDTYIAARRSLVFSKDLQAGTIIQESDLIALRPLKEIKAENINEFLGKKLKINVNKDKFIEEKDFF